MVIHGKWRVGQFGRVGPLKLNKKTSRTVLKVEHVHAIHPQPEQKSCCHNQKIHPSLVEEVIFEDDKGTTTQNK
jgi:hypothetical protein